MTKKKAYFFVAAAILFFLYAFSSDKAASVLTPEESLLAMKTADGFEVKLVAAEPFISTPVALNFDDKGRIWTLEMQGYMPDTLGNGEDAPNGKVVILDDKDGDGVMDDRTVFLDSLVLPRALCLVEDGLLVAVPPNLWYVKNNNDRAGKRILVDSTYTVGGNAEHQPNGLMRGMDNWIYNAKSAKRYRKKGDQWLIERTHFRGQWGISQDDFGRLFYNNNSQNLIGDYFLPSLGAGNKNQPDVPGYNVKIITDNRVYPISPTPGVNRGYKKNVLDGSSRLMEFTAACGPLVYRGGLFGEDYHQNVFVAEPAANLIKRNILKENTYVTEAEQAYEGKEFLASTDERFRPVNLYNGPDGAMYVVDMYRGIIQHRTYLTGYLKKEIEKRGLSRPLNYGRIYKVVPIGKTVDAVPMPHDPTELVRLLQHRNGWVRDRAQQMLVDRKDTAIGPELRKNLRKPGDPVSLTHAMWTLEGLGILKYEDLASLFGHNDWRVRAEVLAAIPSVINVGNYQQFAAAMEQMIAGKDTLAAPYIAFQLPYISAFSPSIADELWMKIARKYPDDRYISGALISVIDKKEHLFYRKILAEKPDTSLAINRLFSETFANIQKNEFHRNSEELKKKFPRGAEIFRNICQTCHGDDGNGIAGLAPPLNQSSRVTGDKRKLISIVLYGLTGPVVVNNKVYNYGEMPGLAGNKEFGEKDIAQLLSFIRKNWSNKEADVSEEDVIEVKQKFNSRQKPFTINELNAW